MGVICIFFFLNSAHPRGVARSEGMSQRDEDTTHTEIIEDLTTTSHDSGDQSEKEGTDSRLSKRRRRLRGATKRSTTPGLVYLSSIPPFMKPHKVRHLLSQYGDVGRVYLQPEGEDR